MSIDHQKHNDKKLINDAILCFYYEHKHFILPILYFDSKRLEGCVIKARCYEFGCEVEYSIEEIKEAVEKSEELKLVLDNDIKVIKENTCKYPESLKSAVDQLFGCRKIKDENEESIEGCNLNFYKDESKEDKASSINNSLRMNKPSNGKLDRDNTRVTKIEDKDEIVTLFKGNTITNNRYI